MKILLLASALVIAGCASASRIVPEGPDSYMVLKQAGSGFAGTENIKVDAIMDANEFCAKSGRQFMITRSKETAGGAMGRYPSVEVGFMCLKPGDPDLTRTKMTPVADTVIEVRKD